MKLSNTSASPVGDWKTLDTSVFEGANDFVFDHAHDLACEWNRAHALVYERNRAREVDGYRGTDLDLALSDAVKWSDFAGVILLAGPQRLKDASDQRSVTSSGGGLV